MTGGYSFAALNSIGIGAVRIVTLQIVHELIVVQSVVVLMVLVGADIQFSGDQDFNPDIAVLAASLHFNNGVLGNCIIGVGAGSSF